MSEIKILPQEATNYSATKNGAIDNFKQAEEKGDCWLLSSLYSLSESEIGEKIIQNSIQYMPDGTSVTFAQNGEYFISNEELEKAKKSGTYAKGDDDVVIYELAMEKLLQAQQNKELTYFDDTPEILNFGKNEDITGGFAREALYLITGKRPEWGVPNHATSIFGKFMEDVGLYNPYRDMETLINRFIKNKDENPLVASITDGVEWSCDIYGNEINLSNQHGYSIVDANKDVITIVDPWDTSKEILLTREAFFKNFDRIESVNLSKNNKEIDYTYETQPYPVDTGDGICDFYYDEFNNISRKSYKDNTGNEYYTETYYNTGQLASTITKEYHPDVYNQNIHQQNKLISNYQEERYFKDGNIKYRKFEMYAADGTLTNYVETKYREPDIIERQEGYMIDPQTKEGYRSIMTYNNDGSTKYEHVFYYNQSGELYDEKYNVYNIE